MKTIEEILDEIVEVCQNFCDKNNINVSVEIDEDFGYYTHEKVVGIALVVDERARYFMDNAMKMGLAYDCGEFITSFLHEIGHHYTLHKLSRRQNKIIDKRKAVLDGRKKKDNYKYFKILDEVLATEWAIKFINANRDLIQELANELIPLMKEIEDL